jgi:putative hemolysin
MATLLREGLLHVGSDPEHFDLVERVLALSNTPVHSVMVPRNRVVSAEVNLGPTGLRSLARECRHTRVPAYEANPRRVVGLVVVHEALAAPGWETLRSLVRPVIALNPQDSVASAILRMQKESQTMGVVVDRAGLMLGLVTLKDLMEEIVGELAAW